MFASVLLPGAVRSPEINSPSVNATGAAGWHQVVAVMLHVAITEPFPSTLHTPVPDAVEVQRKNGIVRGEFIAMPEPIVALVQVGVIAFGPVPYSPEV